MRLQNVLSIDVEDYFHVSGFEGYVPRERWATFPERVTTNTRRLLELFARHDVRATFFVLGWVAHRHPQLVREIAEAGHELGCHSYWHRLVYQTSPDEFRDDLRSARAAIEDAAGMPVSSYRAPSFSIIEQSLWALEVLAEEGFQCDSSIFPIRRRRYGIPRSRRFLHCIETKSGPLWEFPLSVLPIANVNVPVCGGGYFRFFPLQGILWALERLNRTWGRPFMFYIHPWEIDPDQPRLRAGSVLQRWCHYHRIGSTEAKLQALLSRFRFGRLCDVAPYGAGSAVPAVL